MPGPDLAGDEDEAAALPPPELEVGHGFGVPWRQVEVLRVGGQVERLLGESVEGLVHALFPAQFTTAGPGRVRTGVSSAHQVMAEIRVPVGEGFVSASWRGEGATAVVLGPRRGQQPRAPRSRGPRRGARRLGPPRRALQLPLHGRGPRPDPTRPRCSRRRPGPWPSTCARRSGRAGSCSAGRSMGGRIASQVVAGGVAADGLVFLGYPLHPPGSPRPCAIAICPQIAAPMLFVQGTRDAFARPDLLAAVLERLGPKAWVHRVEDGDHSFGGPQELGPHGRRREGGGPPRRPRVGWTRAGSDGRGGPLGADLVAAHAIRGPRGLSERARAASPAGPDGALHRPRRGRDPPQGQSLRAACCWWRRARSRCSTTAVGKSLVLGRIGPGGVVGEVGFIDGQARTHHVRALDGLPAATARPRGLLRLAKGDSELFAKLTIALAQVVARRYRAAMEELGPVRSFAASLREPLPSEPGSETGPFQEIDVPLPMDETVSRIVAKGSAARRTRSHPGPRAAERRRPPGPEGRTGHRACSRARGQVWNCESRFEADSSLVSGGDGCYGARKAELSLGQR